ncbi:dual specificity protein phosphatase [Spiroplasma sp. SV19]|uniref:dual specificity protein phosphatase family protein n=1 Tax=Spiroplasma sp. SV19 TaxID=2570468 RepID=UPI0024B705CF|nr:dual specificity protein phosphatase [Spiroplasma sp. SV19]WHQ36582.1 hypothetical protein E7Y35_01395 [Spiroplasma sp. SV19]
MKIIDNLYLGDQFSQPNNIDYVLKATDISYNFSYYDEIKYPNFKKTPTTLILNLDDGYFIDDINKYAIIAGLKFINYNINKGKIYVHCQRGVSRSASLVFMYLVLNNKLSQDNFFKAITLYLQNFYPNMSVNEGIYQFIFQNYPYLHFREQMNWSWETLGNFRGKENE